MSAIISEQQAFAQLCEQLAASAVIGLDTEFLRERTYFAQLCLLQLSFEQQAVCIDPLALSDLGALRATFGSPRIRKILHAARQDMEVLWPATGAMTGLFDTQVAAALIGLPAQIGYGDLVKALLGHSLHKSQTRTDWSQRPLSEEQLLYALDDVRYLPALAEALQGRLEQLGRWAWFEEEMTQLDAGGSFQVQPEEAWRRVKGIGELDPGRCALARALAAWRERRAIASDRPRNWILPDAALRDIVLAVPRTNSEISHIAELPEGIRRRAGPAILALIDSLGLPAHLPPLAHAQRPPEVETEAMKRLAQVTRQTGRELGIAPEILATRRQMQRLIAGERDAAPLAGWRRDVIGQRLLSAL